MSQDTDQRRSVTELLVALAGPAIWFAHFGSAYAIQGFGCGIAADLMSQEAAGGIVRAGIFFVSVISVGALGLLLLHRYRRSTRERSDADTQDEWRFLHYLQFAIAGLALVAVMWTTMAVLIVPTCAPVFAK